jgi:hypothetical protein
MTTLTLAEPSVERSTAAKLFGFTAREGIS